jgi:hypothetical protein
MMLLFVESEECQLPAAMLGKTWWEEYDGSYSKLVTVTFGDKTLTYSKDNG